MWRKERIPNMRKVFIAALIFLVLVITAGIYYFVYMDLGVGKEDAPKGPQILHLYTWSDYVDPDVIADFEKQNDCQVVIDYFDSNEAMYAKLKAGAAGYDLITPSSYMVAIMRNQGMITKLNQDQIPNHKYVDPAFLAVTEDPKMVYSVPYARTVSGVGYSKSKLGEEVEPSWAVFGRTDLAKRMTLLNDMREAIGAALKYLGYSLNTLDDAELAEAQELLIKWKKNLAKFDVDEAKRGLGTGEFYAVHAYNGDVALVMMENDDISFFVPQEGSSLASDDFVIPVGSGNPALAHKFINYILEPQVAKRNMEGTRYYMPNPDALKMVSRDLTENPAFSVPQEVFVRCEIIRDLGADNQKYISVWDKVKGTE